MDKIQSSISDANEKFLGDGALFKLNKAPVELGVLGISESIRVGFVMKYDVRKLQKL